MRRTLIEECVEDWGGGHRVERGGCAAEVVGF